VNYVKQYFAANDTFVDTYVSLFHNLALPNLTEKGIKKFN